MLKIEHKKSKKCPADILRIVGRFCFIVCMLSCIQPVCATPSDHPPPTIKNGSKAQDIGPMQAAKRAKQQYGGKILKVSREGSMYRVKLLLPSGNVKNVYINAINK